MHILKIENLTVSVENKTILKDFNIEIKSGEIHAIMGPNGTGKSTLSKVIMGDENYKIEKGKILFDEKEINNLPTDERAKLGIFLGYQMPPEIEGVSNADFLRTAIHSKKETFKLYDFIKKINKTVDELNMDKQMIHRGINEGFSGGERKKNEILQILMLKPKFIILDELDSGLDVDSLKIVSSVLNDYLKENPKTSVLIITHYTRMLDYIKPEFVHMMKDGKIVKDGDFSLAKLIEKYGYNQSFDIEGNYNHE